MRKEKHYKYPLCLHKINVYSVLTIGYKYVTIPVLYLTTEYQQYGTFPDGRAVTGQSESVGKQCGKLPCIDAYGKIMIHLLACA